MDGKTVVVVLHEIYGVNRHIKETAAALEAQGYDTLMPDLLGGRTFSYAEAEEAYRHYHSTVGAEGARDRLLPLLRRLRERSGRVLLVGFSVGASAAWLCAAVEGAADGAVCYYGSRIREHAGLEPRCPVLLLWAEQEPGFDVQELSASMAGMEQVTSRIFNAQHGFADSGSLRYDGASAFEADREARSFLKQAPVFPED
ncbi:MULTISPECIES: dienelactone hydrolase family protein [unclassified Paenibacillus]|uniref:dienelactone hydrolase family protein n=1 Tax=unclassified Paenibacillus TaxID=185978 RepID=UPI000955E464|nr:MULTISPECIES: dienelactone hydrolase family protein [unclassified Paenibacillus]QID16042.1 dienelactone hydrolase family protein [Paenibacillus sp. RUD330]SIR28117.1 Dienelactone hydrolase [Paenibacillus sp. RU4X]SIR40539.1 Dienelactone hydrolase [Paenibacillus sp. RU4T]